MRATVTDATLVRGFLNADSFAGGTMALDFDAAKAAMHADVCEPLGLDLDEAADLVCLTCDQAMVGAIEDITIKRGIDPRDYIMVAGGAAAGLHAVAIARELDINEVIVPRFAGVLSAFGILTSNVKNMYGRSLLTRSDTFDFDVMNAVLAELKAESKTYLEHMGIPPEDRRVEFTVEARYPGQIWQITLPLTVETFAAETDVAAMVEDFHALHERLYSVRSPGDPVEIVEINARAVGQLPEVPLPDMKPVGETAQPSGYRSAYFRELGRVDRLPVYRGADLGAGSEIEGPALIEEPLTAIVIPPRAVARVSRYGNYRIRV
jgi:N-methylhydantoinase A